MNGAAITRAFPYLLMPSVWATRNRARRRERGDGARAIVFGGIGLGVMSAAFLHRPKAVLVDEPMVGLDPRGARLIKDVFRRMAQNGVAILMSTHTLEVAQEMCDLISIILKGKIIAHGTVPELRSMAGSPNEELTPVFLKLTGGSGLQEIEEIV